MARIRTIKPDFFRHPGLYRAERDSKLPLRVAFAGLWTAADREGRFIWEPDALKLDCLPYDTVNFARVLEALARHGFIERYEVNGKTYGCIPGWHAHQVINLREAQSVLPARVDGSVCTGDEIGSQRTCTHVHAHGEGKGREGKGKEGKEGAVAADASPSPTPDEPVVLTFPTQGPTASWPLTAPQVASWQQLYPDLDIVAECRQALAYVSANGRKTSRGMPAFLVNWFNRSARMGARRSAPAKRVDSWDSWRPDDEAAS